MLADVHPVSVTTLSAVASSASVEWPTWFAQTWMTYLPGEKPTVEKFHPGSVPNVRHRYQWPFGKRSQNAYCGFGQSAELAMNRITDPTGWVTLPGVMTADVHLWPGAYST